MPPRRAMSLSEVRAVPSRFVSRYSVSQTASSLQLRSAMPESAKALRSSKRGREARFGVFRLAGRLLLSLTAHPNSLPFGDLALTPEGLKTRMRLAVPSLRMCDQRSPEMDQQAGVLE